MSQSIELTLGGQDYVANVLYYHRPCPMRVSGTGAGDADPPEEEELDFELLTSEGTEVHCAIVLSVAELRLREFYRQL